MNRLRRLVTAAALLALAAGASWAPGAQADTTATSGQRVVRTVVHGHPSTTTPTRWYKVPFSGRVRPAAARPIELQVRVHGKWAPVARTRSDQSGHYQLWAELPERRYAYRLFAPATHNAGPDLGRKFRLRAHTGRREAQRVYERRCETLATETWKVWFRVELTTGERSAFEYEMTLQGLPYVGDLVIGANNELTVDVDTSFNDICPENPERR